ncbi:hypothetical protein KP509_22G009400 [Ceratopteris richardii]|uniref:DNA polymerase delta subunit 4 n=1 Tax=Ceratopteris richardii TaxID=49495 RepID=A0A8T2S5U9_CERRI|nr:hypothetical protein KP509_22G009400 [Ceratopteris richardii]
MSTNTSNLSSLYPQRKRKKDTLASDAKKQRSSSHSNFSASNEAWISTENLQYTEDILCQFDMNMVYGPCIGMTRLERWERASRLGKNPPVEVKEILDHLNGPPSCLWEGRI